MEYIDFSGQAGSGDDQPSRPASSGALDRTTKASNKSNRASCDIKPRLTKEQHDILEGHYEKQSKPSTQVKRSFATSLNVTPEKINNWFQNRRAKSKQDAKKTAESFNLYQSPPAASSGPEPSQSFVATSPEYREATQQWSADQQLPNGLDISQAPVCQQPELMEENQFSSYVPDNNQFADFLMPPTASQDMFDSPQEINRRTLTQDQFDVLARASELYNNAGTFDSMNIGYPQDPAMFLNDFQRPCDSVKQQGETSYPQFDGFSMSGTNGPIVHSLPTNQSNHAFPSSAQMQTTTAASATTSEWGSSRSSSIYEGGFAAPMAPVALQHRQPSQAAAQSASQSAPQWKPGQSVPVNVTTLKEEFQQVAQGLQPRMPSHPMLEQPLAWPEDESFSRRDSSTSLLALSMSNVGIQTPQNPQVATFKSPAPAASLASRRQRARPAPLGLNAVRSQSHNPVGGPKSPGQVPLQQQQPNFGTAQPLRRIRSSAVLGTVPQGRVMKSMPGSAQRSPMAANFAEGISSPRAVRHASLQAYATHAPPTPMSPREFQPSEPGRQIPPWQGVTINPHQQMTSTGCESDSYQRYQALASTMGPQGSSPPHTPHFQPSQHFTPPRFSNVASVQSTPPQSAPAGQLCFSADTFGYPQQPQQYTHVHMQAPSAPQLQSFAPPPLLPPQALPAHFVPNTIGDQQFAARNGAYTHGQQLGVGRNGLDAEASVPFANGINGQIGDRVADYTFSYSDLNTQQYQQLYQPPPPQQQEQQPLLPQYMSTPPHFGLGLGLSASADSSRFPGPSAQLPRSYSDFFVHEYSPPDSVRRGAAPRKAPTETNPKNYTFSNAGPENFREKKSRDRTADGKESISPASSNEGRAAGIET